MKSLSTSHYSKPYSNPRYHVEFLVWCGHVHCLILKRVWKVQTKSQGKHHLGVFSKIKVREHSVCGGLPTSEPLWSPSPFRFLYKTPLLNSTHTHAHAQTHTHTHTELHPPPPPPFLCQFSPPSAPSSPFPTTSPPTPPIKPLVFVYYWSSGVKTIQRGCLTCFN